MMANQPPPAFQTSNDDQVKQAESIAVSDTPNGRHTDETASQEQPMEERTSAGKSAVDNKLERPSVLEELSHNGVKAPIQETDVKETKLDQTEAQTKAAITPPPAIDSPASSLPSPPPPPSLVQSSDLSSEPHSESKATVRTAPPALVGCETLDKQVTEDRPEDVEGMELNDGEVSSLDGTQLVEGGNHVKQDEGSSDINTTAQQQLQQQEHQRDMSEESPGLVIDTGSQLETEDVAAPVISERETEGHRENQPLDVSSTAGSSQVLYEEGGKVGGQIEEPSSPQSITSNEEDVELEMDIIEEGEEERDTPPPLPPPIPRGTLMKPPVASTISQARIGVSPSHTANRLAIENLKKGELVRKPNVIMSSPSSSGSSMLDLSRGAGGSNSGKEDGGSDSGKDRQSVVMDNFRVRQVAKVKQLFTTLQQFSNESGSEVAEQVQELITAVVNETATVEEFHQELQSVVNFPVKDFIIPFLKENLKHFQMELKESSRSLSELLGDGGPIPKTIGLTPQLVDDELPVLPSSSQGCGSIRTVGSSVITQSQPSHQANTGGSSASTASRSNSISRSSHTSVTASRPTHQSSASSSSRVHHQHGTGTVPAPHSHTPASIVMDTDVVVDSVLTGAQRKRSRRASIENRSSGTEKEIQMDRGLTMGHGAKRPRSDHTSMHMYGSETTVTTPAPLSHPSHPSSHYPQPPPIHSLTPSPLGHGEGGAYVGGHPLEYGGGGSTRRRALMEDWGHVQKMLGSIQGMVERATQAMAVLKERVNATQTELEKRELERETVIKQRVSEAVEKAKRQSTEEKQRLVLEANSKLRDAVTAARSEIEGRMAQAQALAIQEALKEANAQSSSKENCWNCGRRATETCSGCNKARYCGTFCQHKDWTNHMHHCASGLVGQGNAVEETYERRDNIRHHQPIALATNEVALVPTGRGAPLRQTVAIPLNMVPGNEMNVHGIPTRIPHSHTDIAVTVVKTEKV